MGSSERPATAPVARDRATRGAAATPRRIAGEIDLAGASAKALPDQNQSFCFQICGPRCARDFVVAATDGAEMSKWMRLVDAFGAKIDPASREEAAPRASSMRDVTAAAADDDAPPADDEEETVTAAGGDEDD